LNWLACDPAVARQGYVRRDVRKGRGKFMRQRINTGWAVVAKSMALAALFTSTAAAQAPRQLLNKTVVFSYTSQSLVREPDGRTHGVSTAINYTFYISSAGRIFERSSRTSQRGARQQGQFGPDSPGTTRIGEAHNVHFEGNTIVSLRAFVNGASRTVVSFDPSFSSCKVSVQIGKEHGVFKRKGIDGVVREFLSITTTGETCSLRDGNPFAS
jgi:hypothetical protein